MPMFIVFSYKITHHASSRGGRKWGIRGDNIKTHKYVHIHISKDRNVAKTGNDSRVHVSIFFVLLLLQEH